MNGIISQESLTIREIFDYCNKSANEARDLCANIMKRIEQGENNPSDIENIVFFLQRERMLRCEIPDIICDIVSKRECNEEQTNELLE